MISVLLISPMIMLYYATVIYLLFSRMPLIQNVSRPNLKYIPVKTVRILRKVQSVRGKEYCDLPAFIWIYYKDSNIKLRPTVNQIILSKNK